MKKGWKIALISLGTLLGLAVAIVAVALWLVFTPAQLTKIVNGVAARYITCETHFGGVDLTLFKTFPDAGLEVKDVYVVNPMEGAKSDTVAKIGSLTVGVDLKRFLKENKVVVHQFVLEDVAADLFIDNDGKGNFEIFAPSDDTTASEPFSLDSLPEMDLRKVRVRRLSASLADRKDSMDAIVGNMNISVDGLLREGKYRLESAVLEVGNGSIAMPDLAAALDNLTLDLDAEGDGNAVNGTVKLNLKDGSVKLGDTEYINEALHSSGHDLLALAAPFKIDLKQKKLDLGESRIELDKYTVLLSGTAELAGEGKPMSVDVAFSNGGGEGWQVQPILSLLPMEVLPKGMDLDAKVAFAGTAVGEVGDSVLPLVNVKAALAEGRFRYPQAVPYNVTRIGADLEATLDLNKGGRCRATVNSLKAHTQKSDISLNGTVDDLLGDMLVDANLKAALTIEDLQPLLPDSLGLTATGDADVDLQARFRLSQIDKMDLEHIAATGSIKLDRPDVTMDSLHVWAPSLNVALRMPAVKHKGKMADIHVEGEKLDVVTGGINAKVERPNIDMGLNDITRQQVAAAFDIAVGEAEVNMDSTMVSIEGLKLKGSARLDSTQENIIRQYNPDVDIDLHGAVLYMPTLPDAVRLSQLAVEYRPDICDIKSVEVKLAHSDFQLYGQVENVEGWLDHKKVLQGDLNFTSQYADVDQLLSLISGMGSDEDTLERMREEDKVPADADPFIVPKDVDVTLHTHIKRSIAFGNDLNDVAGAVTIKDGVAVLDQIGFVCKAATMQLTAIYKSPRPSHIFVALDFHLLDILVDELIDMIPSIDTLVPMLSAFEGNANFHLAAETYLNARYEPLMSSLKGAAAISGKNLTVLDNNTIAQIAKFMQFKSWKDKDNKIRIDSLDVELTCLNKVIEVYPFLLNIGKYSICASGMHSLDNKCGYHLELLKNPIMAKVGVDVKGDLSSPRISLGEVRYADFYRPDRQGVVEKQTLELKRQVKEALEAKVR